MSKKKQCSGRREVNTYVYLHDAAKNCIMRGAEEEDGSMFMFMSSLVLTAFTLEAYLNHVGPILIEEEWEKIAKDRSKDVWDKLNIIHGKLNLKIDLSRQPLQTVKKLFTFRDLLAHGKTEKLNGKINYNPIRPFSEQDILQTEWEKDCTSSFAERAIADVSDVITTIHKTVKADKPKELFSADPFLDAGWTTIRLPKD